jgi:hypothetical protein
MPNRHCEDSQGRGGNKKQKQQKGKTEASSFHNRSPFYLLHTSRGHIAKAQPQRLAATSFLPGVLRECDAIKNSPRALSIGSSFIPTGHLTVCSTSTRKQYTCPGSAVKVTADPSIARDPASSAALLIFSTSDRYLQVHVATIRFGPSCGTPALGFGRWRFCSGSQLAA